MAKIKALSFDMYRTLIDTRDYHEQAVREILARERATSIDHDVFHARWDELYEDVHVEMSPDKFVREGDVAIESLRRLFCEYGIDGDAETGFRIWNQKYKEADLYPEVEEVLRILAERYPMVVVSNVDNDDFGYAMFRAKNLPFLDIITSESYQSYKPHEKLFRVALAKLDCQPEEMLHIGDSQRSDVMGAKNVGMRAAWINRRSEMLKPGIKPDYVIADLRELLDLDM